MEVARPCHFLLSELENHLPLSSFKNGCLGTDASNVHPLGCYTLGGAVKSLALMAITVTVLWLTLVRFRGFQLF